MILQEVTPVPDTNLPLEEFKDHLRIGTAFGEDTLQDKVLEGFLRAALSAIESRTAKALIARLFTLTIYEWKQTSAQDFPLAPVTSVSSVVLRDANDVDSTLAASVYRLRGDAIVPQLVAASGCLPNISSGGSAIVTFVAGYGGWSEVPADLKQAVMLLAAHYYEHRNEMQLGQGCMPFGVTALVERYRALRVGFGSAQ